MGWTENEKKIRNIISTVMACFLAVGVLFVSISRASLDVALNNDKNREMRKTAIEATDGNEVFTYKIPQVWVLPDNSLYCLKTLRDYVWLHFTPRGTKRSEIALFIADKKISEAKRLLSENKTQMAIEASKEALNKLKYARNEKNSKEIYHAGWVYAKILESYGQKIKELDEWNKAQKESQ